MRFDQELLKLNDQQLAAVTNDDVPLRIIAGAGSGKTQVITMKIAYLIKEKHFRSWRILAMTFTNKAAQEMKTRIKELLGPYHEANPWISTFHSFFYRVLREEIANTELKKNFTIIDDGEQKILIKRVIKELGLQHDQNQIEKKAFWAIEKFKNKFISPDDILEDDSFLQTDLDRKIVIIYKNYEDLLRKNNYVDFNDLQLKAYQLFLKHPEVLAKWANRFDYFLIDEFQDTNELQFELIKMLVNGRNNLTVVGDPDQTIYSWRGAELSLILNFQKTYTNALTVILDRNYRSTKQILDLANDAISHNVEREKKDLFTPDNGDKVVIYEARTRSDEAQFVLKKIQEYVKEKKYTYKDFFIIYRINAWSQEFEFLFESHQIPYQLVGGFKFRERKVIKDAIAYLRAVSIQDNLAIERVLRETPKVGAVTIAKLQTYAVDNNLTLFEALVGDEENVTTISKNLLEVRQLLLDGRQKFLDDNNVFNLLQFMLIQSGYDQRLKILSKDEEDEQNLQILFDQLKTFDTNFDEQEFNEPNHVLAFLQEEALDGNEEKSQLPNRVTLLTAHSAKGLENKVVFLVGVNRDVFPSRRSRTSNKQLEEERRTFYVGMTRAQEELFITYVSGEWSYLTNGPLEISKFIQELNQDLYVKEAGEFAPNISKRSAEPVFEDRIGSMVKKDEIQSDLVSGDLVNHVMFGDGIIIKRIGNQFRIAFTDVKYGIQLIEVDNPALSKKNN